jgi:integrase
MNWYNQFMPISLSAETRTVTVVVRHSAACNDISKGSEWRKCKCPKSLVIYNGATQKTSRVSAKTRSWEKATEAAQKLRDSWNPDKAELKKLRAEQEKKLVPITEAVSTYHNDMVTRLGKGGTLQMSEALLGKIDPMTMEVERVTDQVTKKVKRKPGHLFRWLESYNATHIDKLINISDITGAHLTEWRSGWTFKSDLTRKNKWVCVKGFFRFCESLGWIQDSPARKLRQFDVAKGNRTCIFSDEQYASILDAVYLSDPENVPEATRAGWQQRLTTFVELLRWSGMSLVDAVQWSPALVDDKGVLSYRRQKSGELAVVPLPERLLVLLRDIPLERDSLGANQPFRSIGNHLQSDARCWAHRVEHLFGLAGITEVQTDQRVRQPHIQMFRDTAAVWCLTHGASLHSVARMLGHASTKTTEKAYLPWVRELQDAHIADIRKAHAGIKAGKGRVVRMKKRG